MRNNLDDPYFDGDFKRVYFLSKGKQKTITDNNKKFVYIESPDREKHEEKIFEMHDNNLRK